MSRTDTKRLGSAVWGVLIGAGVAMAIAACAAGKQPMEQRADPKIKRIEELMADIREKRVEAGLKSEPNTQFLNLARKERLDDMRVCPDDPNPGDGVCGDVCSLKDAICENAESICRIADQIGDDDWANRKCDSAKASCKEATEKCCSCAAGEKSGQ